MPEDLGEVYNIRGLIVSQFASYEQKVNTFIAKHFASDNHGALSEEVLENEGFPFYVKKNIFYRILKNRYPEYAKTFPHDSLDEFQILRNVIAHGAVVTDPESTEAKVCLRHGARFHSIQEKFEEFKKIDVALQGAFENLPLSGEKKEVEVSGIG